MAVSTTSSLLFLSAVAVAALATLVSAANVVKCPLVENAVRYPIAHARQCDKFHYCTRGVITNTFLCDDGLVFDGKTCSLPYGIDCSERSLLQTPKGQGRCFRRNGNFPVDDSCDQYINCHSGVETLVSCAQFLIFDPITGVCRRPDETTRPACSAKEQYSFDCPIRSGHHVFPSPGDCRAFFTCTYPHYVPILGGCSYGTVFNEDTQRCDDPENVAGCERHYVEEEEEEEVKKKPFNDGKYREGRN